MRRIEELRFDVPAVGRWSLYVLAPPAELAAFVEVFWEVHGFADYARERILPKTNIELMFNLGPAHRIVDPTHPPGARVYRDAWVAGLQRRPLVIEPCFDASRVPSHLIAARLRPEGAYALFGCPMNELSNDVIDLDLISSRFSTLHARLLETASRHERFAQLEALVRERVATQVRVRPFIRWATAQIERTHGAVRILDLCRDLGVSRKHLNQWFHSQVGLAPKQYAGVARFQRLIACLTRAPASDWSDLAQNCGFYDQAHLVHDCRAFAGMAPGALRESLSPDGTATIESGR
jgi:AraC-like DNA-binding protein